MRDKRLLSVAVLAVALGSIAAAPALADMAVATLIVDPNGAAGTWESRVRLWSDLGPGTAPSGLGFMDFVLVEVTGAATSINESPLGVIEPTGGGTQLNVGFSQLRTNGTGGVGIMAVQPVAYGDTPDPLLDQLVLPGIGVADNPGWTPPAGHQLVGPAPSWDADTLVASGTYVGDPTSLGLTTEGNLSFSYLEDSGDGNWHGPVNDLKPWVSATVTQVVIGGTGNDGGTFYDRKTVTNVVEGTVSLPDNLGDPSEGADDTAVALVDMTVGAASTMSPAREMNAELVLNSDQDLAGLSVNYAPAGIQTLDLNSPAAGVANLVRVYSEDLAATEADLTAAVRNAKQTASADGIIDSGIALNPSSDIGITDGAVDPNGAGHVLMRLTLIGDTDVDGDVDFSDLTTLLASFNSLGTTWDQGNGNYDGSTDFGDLTTLLASFGSTFAPPPPSALPEPATMALVALGGLAVLRRRRR